MPTTKSKKPNSAPPSGIKPSYHSGIPTSSIGIPTLDAIIGGGLSLGSLFLIESDDDNAYSKIIEKCFLTLGDVYCHQTFYSNFEDDIWVGWWWKFFFVIFIYKFKK